MKLPFRASLLLSLSPIAMLAPTLASAQEAAAPIAKGKASFNIAAKPIDEALTEFSLQTGVELMLGKETQLSGTSDAVVGVMTPEQALDRLLGDRKLRVTRVDAKTFVIDTLNAKNATGKVGADGSVVVTGERFKLRELNNAVAVKKYDVQEARMEGVSSVAQVLQRIPQAVVGLQVNRSLVSQTVIGGPGTETVSLYGLGAGRTLVLLNGRRLGPSGVGGTVSSIDLSTIPFDALSRIDVQLDGSSAVYGSDAEAGMINFVTNDRRDISVASISGSLPQRGTGGSWLASYTTGKTFGNGYVNFFGSVRKDYGLRAGDRYNIGCTNANIYSESGKRLSIIDPITKKEKCFNNAGEGINVVFSPSIKNGFSYQLEYPKDGVDYPKEVYQVGQNGEEAPQDGTYRRPDGFIATARSPFDKFFFFGNEEEYQKALSAWAATSPYRTTDLPEKTRRQTVIMPLTNYTALITSGYDFSPNVSLYHEFMFNKRTTFESQFIGGVYRFQPNAQLNPYKQEGQFVSPSMPYERNLSTDVNYYRNLVGITGSFGDSGLLPGWRFDAYYQVSLSDAKYDKTFVSQGRLRATYANYCDWSYAEFFDELTGSRSFPVPCPPIDEMNVFSKESLRGNLSNTIRNFLILKERGTTRYVNQALEASMRGTLLTLPAGEVPVAIGAFYSTDYINDKPGIYAQNHDYADYPTAGLTQGRYRTPQFYLETRIPILRNIPFFRNLDLSGSARHSRYNDGIGSSTVYKYGVLWNLNDEYSLSVTGGTSFSPPKLYQKHLKFQEAFATIIDPCLNPTFKDNSLVQENCTKANLIPEFRKAGYPIAGVSYYWGNGENLKPETARNFRASLSWTPSSSDMKATLSFNNIDMRGAVELHGPQLIANLCYSRPQPNRYCRGLERSSQAENDANGNPIRDPKDPTGYKILGYTTLSSLNDEFLNARRILNRSIQFDLSYGSKFPWGRIRVESQNFYMLKFFKETIKDYFENSLNTPISPVAAGQQRLIVQHRDLTVQAVANIIAPTSIERFVTKKCVEEITYLGWGYTSYCYKRKFPVHAEFSLGASYQFPHTTLTMSVSNLFDAKPPSLPGNTVGFSTLFGNASLGPYDLVGRSLYLNVTRRF